MTPCCDDNTVANDSCTPLGGDDSPIQTRKSPTQTHDVLVVTKENETEDVVPQRRASFQRSTLRDLRINQKKAFDTLKQAVRKSEKLNRIRCLPIGGIYKRRPQTAEEKRPQTAEQVMDECLEYLMATKIQAVVRGFVCRQNSILRKCEPRRDSVQRRYSEITMSDFSDSFHSLGSLELSPRTHMRSNEECCYNNNNSFTSRTWDESDPTLTFHDSIPTIFSVESTDLPVKRPARKPSPPPTGLRAEKENAQDSSFDLQLPLMTTKTTSRNNGSNSWIQP
jgi:hypothetical protein